MANVKISDMTAGGALTGAELFEMVQGALSRSTTAAALATLAGAALNASNLTSGTVPDARFPATLPAISGVNLTALNATNLASGTVPDARFPATLPALSGVNLTALNATNIASGSLADARLSANVPLLNVSNVFTSGLTISNTGPTVRWNETDAAANNRLWDTFVSAEQWKLRLVDDAVSAGVNVITVDRTLNVADQVTIAGTEVQIDATTLDFNGAADISGTLQVNGVLTAASTSTHTGGATFNASAFTLGAAAISINANNPGLIIRDADGAVDTKEWLWAVEGGVLRLYLRTDASTGSNRVIDITRTADAAGQFTIGTPSITEFEVNATTLDFNGNLDVDSTTHDINGTTSVTLTSGTAVVTLTNADDQVDLTGTIVDINGTTTTIDGTTVTLTGGSAVVTLSGTEVDLTATTLDFNGKVVLDSPITLKGYTVATLPAGTQGDRAFVTDALAPTYAAALTGGGAVVVPAFYNGAAWIAA